MKIHFFKYNIVRQLFIYCTLIIMALGVYDGFIRPSTVGLWICASAAAVLLLILVYQYMSYLIVDEEGIMYRSLLKRYTMKWDEIGQVRVIKRWNGNSLISWIIILKSDNPTDLYKKKNAFNRKGKCITFAYNADAERDIKTYRQNRLLDQPVAIATKIDRREKNRQDQELKTTVLNPISILYMVVPFLFVVAFGVLVVIVKINSGLYTDAYKFGATMCIFPIILIGGLSYFLYGRYQFTISKKGVEFRHRKSVYRMAWEDMKDIRLLPNGRGAMGKWSMICFFSQPDISVGMVDIKAFDHTFFGVQYRKKVVQEIQKYWDEQINGIYQADGKSRL